MAANEPIRDPSARVRDLCNYASQVDVDNSVPPKRYFRSGVEMERMANIYLDEGNLESAFILYSKFITLFVEKLPSHTEYLKASPQEKQAKNKRIQKIFPLAENLKKKLINKYEEELREWEAVEAKKREEEAVKQEQERLKAEEQARQEQQIRLAQALAQEQQEQERSVSPAALSTAPALLSDFPGIPTALPSAPPAEDFDPPSETSPESREGVIGANHREFSTPASKPAFTSLFSVPNGPPTVDRTTKPASISTTDLSSHLGLRKIVIPLELTSKFLRLASSNTRQNLETCGILAGKLQKNMFSITHLLIPKQTSTSDSCTTLHEEELFEQQDVNDLITLGWIHTHPSQTSFMSSVDLHTHCSYQLMMPEAIAIVCAPKYSENNVFTLTPGYGLQFVASCKKAGFHPHPKEPPLYEQSGHVSWDNVAEIEIVDLR